MLLLENLSDANKFRESLKKPCYIHGNQKDKTNINQSLKDGNYFIFNKMKMYTSLLHVKAIINFYYSCIKMDVFIVG